MLNAIISWSLHNRMVVLFGAVLLAAAGVFAVRDLPIDAFPDTTPVQVQINTIAPALAPEEVERQITFPVEQSISGLPRLVQVRSVSKFGLSQVVVTFADGTDIYFARQLISERIAAVELPRGIARPKLGPVSTGLGEVLHFAVAKADMAPAFGAAGGGGFLVSVGIQNKTLTDLRTVQDWVIKPALRTVPGTAEINSWGGLEKQYQVRIDPDKLIKYGVSFQQVQEALQASNFNVGGGTIRQAGEALLVHGIGYTTSVRQIGNIVVAAKGGTPVFVRDVADVRIGHDIRRGAVTADGQGEVVLGLGFMLMGENSHDVTRRLTAKLADVEKTLPPGIQVVKLYDRTELVDHVIDTVRRNLFEGGFLVVAVLFVFLGNLRAGLIVAVAIPLSMLFAFCGMWRFAIAGSLLSLGALDFGLVVDSSVVLIENVVRHLAHGDAVGRDKREVVRDAAVEVRRPTLFGELIILIVYLPILTLQGVEGKLFRPMALTVIFALLGSLILSMTVMPVLASLLLPQRLKEEEALPVRAARWATLPLLRVALRFAFATVGLAIIALYIAVLMLRGVGSEFVPRLSEGAIVGNVKRLAGTDIDEVVRMNTQLERLLLQKFPDEIEHVWSRCGVAEVATDPMGIEETDIFIALKPREQWREEFPTQAELAKAISDTADGFIGQIAAFSQPIEQRINEMISGVKGDVAIKVYGDDFGKLSELSREIEAALREVDPNVEVVTEQLTGQPVLQIQVKLEEMARYNIPARTVLDYIEAIGGKPISDVIEGQLRFPLVVRLAERWRQNPAAIANILIPTPTGEQIPLSRVANLRVVEGPAVVSREWSQRRTVVQCNVRDRDIGSFVADAKRKIAERVHFPANGRYRIEWGGTFENLERATNRLMIVVPLALLMIFALLYVTFHNVPDALRVFTGVPFAVVGGVLALWLRGMPFSISAGVGFIALSGVSVLNSMLLVTFIRQARDRGVPLDVAVQEAVRARLRAVLMTALVASLGFLPMALSTGMGAEVQRPLATVVIGGVISSTLLTLLVLPVIYRLTARDAPPAVVVPEVGPKEI